MSCRCDESNRIVNGAEAPKAGAGHERSHVQDVGELGQFFVVNNIGHPRPVCRHDIELIELIEDWLLTAFGSARIAQAIKHRIAQAAGLEQDAADGLVWSWNYFAGVSGRAWSATILALGQLGLVHQCGHWIIRIAQHGDREP